MLHFFAGVPGRLKALLDRLTATRAGYLDNLTNLDAAVTSRAAASTALSTATWTGTLAANLGTISSGATAFTGIVASIQYGSISVTGTNTSATATITSVNTNKAALIYLGSLAANSNGYATITLTNATTITAYRSSPADNGTTTVRFCVVEFK